MWWSGVRYLYDIAELLFLRLRIYKGFGTIYHFAFKTQLNRHSDIACDGTWQEGAVNAVQEHVHSIRAQGRKLEAHLCWWLCTFTGLAAIWPTQKDQKMMFIQWRWWRLDAWKNLDLSRGAWEVFTGTTHCTHFCVGEWLDRRPINYPLKKD